MVNYIFFGADPCLLEVLINSFFLVQQGWYITLVDRCHLSEIIGGCQDFKYLTAHLMLVNILDTDFSFKILIWIFDITLA